MSAQAASPNGSQGTDNGWGEMIIVVAATFVVLLMIPPAVLGYFLYCAATDKRGGPKARVARTMLILGLYLAGVYYLFGPHADFVQSVWPVSKAGRQVPLSFWAGGAVLHNFMTPTKDVLAWVIRTLPRGITRNTPSRVFDAIRHMAYWPVVLGPIAAVGWAWFKPKDRTFYRGARRTVHWFYFAATWGAHHFAMKGDGPTAFFMLALQAGGGIFFSWLISTISPGLAFLLPLGVFYFGSGFVMGFYAITVGELAGRRYKVETKPEVISFGVDRLTRGFAGLTLDQLRHHVHVVGASGFGKSVFLMILIRHHVKHRLGLIFVDLKADHETVSEITALAQVAGRISDLKILDLSRPKISMAYNPCRRGNATEIKDKIVGAFEWESEYYKNASQSFLLTSLRALCFLRDEMHRSFTLDDIYQATLSPDSLIALEMELNRTSVPASLKEDINDLASWLRLRENFKELQGLRTQLKMLLDSAFGASLKSDRKGIDFFSAIQNQELVYVLLDSQTYGETAKKLGKLILQDMKSCSGTIATQTAKENRQHCTFIVDEFADLATDQFVGFINRARGSRLGIVIAHQDVSDLSAFSDSMRDQVMTCTSTTVSFLQKVPESAERIAGLAGTKTVKKRTRQIGEVDYVLFKSKGYTGVESERDTEEYNIHPNILKNLAPGQCVVIGKYPSSWHAEVQVLAPPAIGYGTENSSVVTLSQLKESIEREPSGFLALNLKERAARFREGDRKKRTNMDDDQARDGNFSDGYVDKRPRKPATTSRELTAPPPGSDMTKKLERDPRPELDDRF